MLESILLKVTSHRGQNVGLGESASLPLPTCSLIIANGYVAIPLTKTTSLFIQWMSISKPGDGTTSKAFTFPVPFPTACASAVATDSGNAASPYGLGSLTKTGGLLYVPASATGGILAAKVIAIGY